MFAPTLLGALLFAALAPLASLAAAQSSSRSSETQSHSSESGGNSQTPSPSGGGVSTSWYQTASLIVTNGNRVYTTISVPVIITPSSSGSSAGGNTTNPTQKGNSTVLPTSGGNGTAIQSSTVQTSTTPTTLPFAPTTVPYGGGGTSVAAPVPGGTGPLQQGPGDNGATQVVVSYVHSIIAILTATLTMSRWLL